MKSTFTYLFLIASLCIATFNFYTVEAQEIPLVYQSENSIDPFPVHLPVLEDLSVIETLPDPFAWSDGSGRLTSFEDWARRTNNAWFMEEMFQFSDDVNKLPFDHH